MKVIPVACLTDNYSYLLIDESSLTCAAVDPVEPDKVLAAANAAGVRITHILTTHSHWDHAGGNLELLSKLGEGVQVVGGASDDIPGCTNFVKHGDTILFGQIHITVLDTPGHTKGHVCFHAECDGSIPVVFSGDVLFVGGSGNLNGSLPAQMHHALVNVLGSLPFETVLYYGHNYTEKNLRWAQVVEPLNVAISTKLEYAKICNRDNVFIMSSIGSEKETNPFVRCSEPTVQQWAGCEDDPVKTLLAVRKGKDEWGKHN